MCPGETEAARAGQAIVVMTLTTTATTATSAGPSVGAAKHRAAAGERELFGEPQFCDVGADEDQLPGERQRQVGIGVAFEHAVRSTATTLHDVRRCTCAAARVVPASSFGIGVRNTLRP